MLRLGRRDALSTIAFSVCLALVAVTAAVFSQEPSKDGYILPPAPITDYINRDKNYATLDQMSPDGDHFYIASTTELSTLRLMSQKIYRLAMLKVTPETNRELDYSTYGIFALKIYSLKDKTSRPVTVPQGTFFSDLTWSPDGHKLAFLANLPKGSQVWIADAATGESKPLNEALVMATLAKRPETGGRGPSSPLRLLQWMPDGSIVTLLVPGDRGPEPAYNPVPSSPIIRRSLPKPSPTATQPFLLQTEHDKDLLRYYTTAQLAILTPGQAPRKLGQPAMYMGFSLSPDGRYLLAEKMVEPFSYLVPHAQFGHNQEVLDISGKVLATVARFPLNEGLGRDAGAPDSAGAADLPREVQWRPDGKGLSFVWLEERKKGASESDSAERKDRVILLAPPFDLSKVQTLVASQRRISETSYSADGKYLFATLAERVRAGAKRKQQIAAYDLTAAQPQEFVVVRDYDPDDIVNLPGSIMTRANGNGIVSTLVSTDGQSAYLDGPGYKADFKPRPFVDRIVIRSAEKQRIFEGSDRMYEHPRVAFDNDLTRMIVTREGKNIFPDSYLWTKGGGQMENLTHNQDPYPDITAAKRIDFNFKRSDGVTVYGRISLPLNYKEGTRVPAVFWDYPREFAGEEEYGRDAIRSRNENAYTPLSFLRWSDLWLTQGYALVYTDIPILGKGNQFNDFYVTHLLDSVYGAIRKLDQMGLIDVDRLGHGGHSYGAFTTGNLLAHSPFFKAGIAGDGAYNRTLTPMTFQSERRFFWEAQTTYERMSPFFFADQIEAPMLMYHGGEDDNSGTFVIQSQRMMQALTGLGKKAALFLYPFEAHSPRCKETYLDIWARWIDWFDTYVKNPAPKGESKP